MRLPADEVHLWTLSDHTGASGTGFADEASLLSADEVERAARFHFERDRRRFIATRSLIRQVLSKYEAVAPAAWRFSKTRYGGPVVLPEPGRLAPSFSVSHTRGLIVCAVAREPTLGIDVEYLTSMAPMSIASRFFTKREAKAIQDCPPDERAQLFFQYWTLKEAYLKATGKGLHQSLDSIEFRVADAQPIDVTHHSGLAEERHECDFWSLKMSSLYVAAACIKRQSHGAWRIRTWHANGAQDPRLWQWHQMARSH
jgi:4'-phosphopantetheinyl transferase